MNCKDEYQKWVEREDLDEELKRELIDIKDDDKEIYERFYAPLAFGTGGLRGILRAGVNGMNVYTVAQATAGLSNLIKSCGRESDGVVIASDTRNKSDIFSKICAEVLSASNIKVYIFDAPRPTPELSFAIRHLNAVAGINITASHNPNVYNGYKAYWDDGAQLPPDHAKTVLDEILKIDLFDGVKKVPFEDGLKSGLIEIIGKETDESYLEKVLNTRINKEAIPNSAETLKIVYTPLHGAGAKLVPEILKRAGLKYLYCVKEQMIADGNFPTVKSPNPENRSCFDLAIPLAIENNCNLLIGTDPDADRCGIVVKTKDGEFVSLTGNQVGALLLSYVINGRKNQGTLPKNACAIKSIVSTKLADSICEKENIKLISVLTGFKFIGEKIKEFESSKEYSFVFGFEESYGYLAGTYARDKDAVGAALLICEMAADYEKKGMTLYDAMQETYEKYGYFAEKVDEIVLSGSDGIQKSQKLMNSLRKNSPKELAGKKVVSVADYLSGTVNSDNGVESTGLPTSDVLYYTFEDNSSVAIRPSGTEPKVKMYYLVCGKDKNDTEIVLQNYREAFNKLLTI